MGAWPLRRAIQRYVEDPLADEVLRAADLASGTTVLVDRDPAGDEEDRPLKMKLVKPKNPGPQEAARWCRRPRRRHRDEAVDEAPDAPPAEDAPAE